jgi:2-phosphoglycerate kinase
MIILIAGDTHTGKTYLAQRLLEKHGYPYLSIDHLKMGLIRSGETALIATDSWEKLTTYLWPIVVGIIKTAIENGQNLIVEGCYMPFDYRDYFDFSYSKEIEMVYLIFSETYIHDHFEDIRKHARIIEHRLMDDDLDKEKLIGRSRFNRKQCEAHGVPYTLIDTPSFYQT